MVDSDALLFSDGKRDKELEEVKTHLYDDEARKNNFRIATY